jgi:hypothetical protein
MATVNRGDTGDRHDSQLHVARPDLNWRENRYRVEGDIIVTCSTTDDGNTEQWGFPVTITMTHDEALKLLADLAARLAMRVNPPKPPKAERVDSGIDILEDAAR